MDVKSAFLNGYLYEEVNVSQPKGFIDPIFPHVRIPYPHLIKSVSLFEIITRTLLHHMNVTLSIFSGRYFTLFQ